MPGLRELHKARTRVAIETAAEKLFSSRGFDDTTVEDIADAADVSPRTFFRYFPTKEDVVFAHSHEQIDQLLDVLDGRPLDEPPIDSLLAAVKLLASDEVGKQASANAELVAATPSLQSRALLMNREIRERLIDRVAARTGRSVADVDVRLAVSQTLAAVAVAVETFGATSGRSFGVHLDRVLAKVSGGWRELLFDGRDGGEQVAERLDP